jgi:hypothetical protein
MILALAFLACVQDPAAEMTGLIDKLQGVTAEGLGYSSSRAGSQFLPLPGTDLSGMLLLGQAPPESSAALRKVVEKGAAIVPLLLDHLQDIRVTEIQPLKGMEWTQYSDYLENNRRLKPPAGPEVEKEISDAEPGGHVLTVGDLCFVALGQILNRRYDAARYQASGGMVIHSPTFSKALRDKVRAEWKGLTEAGYRQSLTQDFEKPDNEYRRTGAYYRLAFYYPDAIEPLVLKQLAMPTFNVYTAEAFARGTLYKTADASKRKALFEEFVRTNGPASRDGLLKQLFEDLDHQEAVEEKRTTPWDSFTDQPRKLLIELYGLPAGVRAKDIPWFESCGEAVMERFVKALVHDKSAKIDEAVFRMFSKIQDNDSLALSCMARLIGRGHDGDLLDYCERRAGKSQYWGKELEAIRDKLKQRRQ